jgi:hypothetical protein
MSSNRLLETMVAAVQPLGGSELLQAPSPRRVDTDAACPANALYVRGSR